MLNEDETRQKVCKATAVRCAYLFLLLASRRSDILKWLPPTEEKSYIAQLLTARTAEKMLEILKVSKFVLKFLAYVKA